MDLISTLFVFAGIAIVSYFYAKKKRLESPTEENKNDLNALKEELERRARIIDRVESFIKGSKFIEPIATWRNDKIYKYIFNNGYLYEFEDILPETNQRIGIDENYLCFKQFCYKRVNNPVDFMEKFGNTLA